MRLIDADKLVDYFYCVIDDKPIIDGISDRKIIDIIKNQPTAYDVDKVVEQLEEVKNKDTEIALDEAQKERCFWYAQGMNRAIEIVKGGVIDAGSI